ncbi:hypothetical protein [Sphingomonas sp. MMS24-J13]|uniref:hypothetical protein n=1 Tax=Sphingomonas sp. MMS24-J13 TaxID=3238686 RepID=UPI00384B4EE1
MHTNVTPEGPQPIETYDFVKAPVAWLISATGERKLGSWGRQVLDEKTGEFLIAAPMGWGQDTGGDFRRFEGFEPVSFEAADEAYVRDTMFDL